MYGTIMRARVKPGVRHVFEDEAARNSAAHPDGYLFSELAWEDSDAEALVLIVHFRDRASYLANAASPEQDAQYRRMLQYFEGEPEWIDIRYAATLGPGGA
ncbi:MAG TPA: antibiotic biosynthesis monooxygenase [Actinomycetota bacterium]|nr:antibiotic biosynthesis monooxygenase [Actinomycetota bacterium]